MRPIVTRTKHGSIVLEYPERIDPEGLGIYTVEAVRLEIEPKDVDFVIKELRRLWTGPESL